MLAKLALAWSLMVLTSLTFADCDFIIINYTDSAVSLKAGFYGGIESNIVAKAADTSILRIKSDYKCNSATKIGLGRAYIRFPKDPHHAGANYSASDGQINFLGKFTGETGGRIMNADNGTPVWLNSTGLAIDETTFQVKFNFISRPNSFSAGTQ